MRGDKVIVRSYGNKPLVRRVWEVTPDAIFICSEENYKTLIRGEDGLLPVGFPREFVYRYNSNVNVKSIAWDKLTVYEN